MLIEMGERPIQNGGRADRNEIYKLLTKGAHPLELMNHDFSGYCRFQRGIQEYYQLMEPERPEDDDEIEVYIFYGPPGCGKTELALKQFPVKGINSWRDGTYRLPIGKNFWTTPKALKAQHILVDDFKSNVYLSDLLQLTDKHPVEVERKGSHLWWCPKTIIFTTNVNPHNWYKYNNRDYEKEALFRRIRGCYRFEKNDDKVPRPFEVDLFDPESFAPIYKPPQPKVPVSINTVFMNLREDDQWCIIHGKKKCCCHPCYLIDDTAHNQREALQQQTRDPNDLDVYNTAEELFDSDSYMPNNTPIDELTDDDDPAQQYATFLLNLEQQKEADLIQHELTMFDSDDSNYEPENNHTHPTTNQAEINDDDNSLDLLDL